jgi:hypothetical protein
MLKHAFNSTHVKAKDVKDPQNISKSNFDRNDEKRKHVQKPKSQTKK